MMNIFDTLQERLLECYKISVKQCDNDWIEAIYTHLRAFDNPQGEPYTNLRTIPVPENATHAQTVEAYVKWLFEELPKGQP